MILKKPKISIICCIAKNRGIGKDNKLLFDIPEDLKHFKKITFSHPVIMGQRTYESIGRPLPGRLNIVLSPDKNLEIDGCTVCSSIDEAIDIATENDQEEIFFIGGGMVYKQAIEIADRLYLTVIDEEPEADTFFPDYSSFKTVISEEQSDSVEYKFKYLVLER